MNQLFILYRYELKKILNRKIVWISICLCFTITAFTILSSLIGDYYVEGVKKDTHYNMFQIDKKYQQALNGREINQALLDEVSNAYGMLPDTDQPYAATEEYQLYARPYSSIFNFIGTSTNMTTAERLAWKADEGSFYQMRLEMLEELWQNMRLSDGEKEFWNQKETKIQKPFVYFYKESYWMLFDSLNTISLLALMLIAICLSGVFPEEHVRKTDQLILCSTQGKCKLYWAKILSGISFSAGISLALSSFAFILAFCVYGAEGFGSAFQLIYSRCSYPLTTGQALLISYGMIIIVSIAAGVFVMTISELLRGSIAALSISTGILILSMLLNIPEQYRVLSQIWSWLPGSFLSPWNIFDIRLISVFGQHFTAWQAVPVLYLISGAVIALIGKAVYQNYQVSGR